MKKFLPLLFFFYLPVAVAKTDPALSWTTLTSPHFQVHFHQGEEALAKRVVALAEDVHNQLAPRMKSQPHEPTHIVLLDALDDANGFATPLPYNLITLYITQPYGASILGASHYDDWMRLLITHEYTHIVQLDMVNGPARVLRKIFGNLYFPNMFQPVWLVEGLGVYEETELTGGGRNRSPLSDMILRMAALENNFPPISHAANFTEKWPGGAVPYLFGGSFINYLAEKYGREKVARLSLEYSGRAWPFLNSSTAYRVLGKDYVELWEEWKADLSRRYQADKKRIEASDLSASRALTPNATNQGGYMNLAPAISPDGQQIAYTVDNADEHTAIYLMNMDGSNNRKLLDNNVTSASSIAWAPDGNGFYYSKIEVARNTNLYNDIYYYDIQQRREIRLTKNLRARDAAPSPDGNTLVFVTNWLGKTRLASVPLIQKQIAGEESISWLGQDGEYQFETPRFSPDGEKIVVGVRQPDGFKDIWILDKQGNKLEALMHDRAVDISAIWDNASRSIYFSSDRSGIFNLYNYDLASKKISQVSNVVGGAFTPALSPDGGTIAFANYSSRGFDIHVIENNPAEWRKAAGYINLYPAMKYTEPAVHTELSPYSPATTLYPRLWLPNFGYSSYSGTLAGLFTFGRDAIQRHSYTLSALYGPSEDRTWYDFNYQYDGFYPTLKFRMQDVDTTYSDLLQQRAFFIREEDYVERSRKINLSLTFETLKLDQQHALTVGYDRQHFSSLSTLPPWFAYDGTTPAQGVLAGTRLSYLFNNAKMYGYSISPEDGRSVELGYQHAEESIGSDFNVRKSTVDWHEYINIPVKHHVLLLRGFAGKSTGDVFAQGAFQLGGDNPGDITINVEEKNVYLRGYPANEYRGQKAVLASAEYRFPVHNIEWGGGNTPFFFKRVHGAVFAEAGNAWDGAYNSADLKKSIGAEARLDMTLSYFVPITVRAGLAHALDGDKDTQVIASLWIRF